MRTRRLGNSGLKVSEVGLGCNNFGMRIDQQATQAVVDAAIEAGITLFDTADIYGGTQSEVFLGKALGKRRHEIVLASKFGMQIGEDKSRSGASRRWILAECDASLRRLRTDYIDIYYLHIDDAGTPLDETVAAMGTLIDSGKIRYFGVSNFRGWRIAELVRCCERQHVAPPVVCQPYYNLLNRMPEVEVLAACDHYGIGVASYSPIARGVLTGKYAGGVIPGDSRAARNDRRLMQTEFRSESFAIAQQLAAHAAKTGRTPVQFALAWLWANRIVTSAIAGPRTLDQWRDYVAAIGTPWSAADEALVDSLVHPGHPSTPGYSDPQYPICGRRLAQAQLAEPTSRGP